MFLALDQKRTMAGGWQHLHHNHVMLTHVNSAHFFQACGNLLSSDHPSLECTIVLQGPVNMTENSFWFRETNFRKLSFTLLPILWKVSLNWICQFFLSIVSGFQFTSKAGKIHDTLRRPIEEAVLHPGTKIIIHLAISLSISSYSRCRLPSFVLRIVPAHYLNDHHDLMVIRKPTDMGDM